MVGQPNRRSKTVLSNLPQIWSLYVRTVEIKESPLPLKRSKTQKKDATIARMSISRGPYCCDDRHDYFFMIKISVHKL